MKNNYERHDSALLRHKQLVQELRELRSALEAVERRMGVLAEACFDEPTQPDLRLGATLREACRG